MTVVICGSRRRKNKFEGEQISIEIIAGDG